jgi:hypothetical protein
VLVAGQHPAAHRDALAGHREPHGHKGQIITLFLGFSLTVDERF